MASWLDKYNTTSSNAQSSWLSKYDAAPAGYWGVGDEGQPVWVQGEAPQDAGVQREGLLNRVGSSLGRMISPVTQAASEDVRAIGAGLGTVPAQARALAGGAQQAYAEQTPRWMFPLSSREEVEAMRSRVGQEGAARFAAAQEDIERQRQGAIEAGATPFLLDVATSAPTTAAMAAGSALAGPAVGVGLLGALTAPRSYGELRAEGLSPEDALAASAVDTAAEMVPSILPASVFARASQMGRGPAFAAGYLAEGAQEGSTDVLQQINRMTFGVQDEFDVTSPFRSAAAGGLVGGPIAGAMGRTRTPAIQTGDPDIDAGAQLVAEAQAQAGLDIAPASRTPAPTEQGDMFTRTGESQMIGDMFGGAPSLGSDVVRTQQLREAAEARDAEGNLLNPELNRLQDQTTDLERDYIFTMQERLQALRAERENLIRNGQPVEANNQRIENLVNEWARTGERNPAIADAFARAGLRQTTGAQEDAGYVFPTVPETIPEVPDVFEPSRVPTVEQEAEQAEMGFQFRDVGQRTIATEDAQGLLDLPMPPGPSVRPQEATQQPAGTQVAPAPTRAQRAVQREQEGKINTALRVKALKEASDAGITPTPQWLATRVDQFRQEAPSIPEMAQITSPAVQSPRPLEYYNSREEIPQRFLNPTPVSNAFTEAMPTGTHTAANIVSRIRPQIKDAGQLKLLDRLEQLVDLNEIDVHVVSPSDAPRFAGTKIGYLLAKGKEAAFGAYEPNVRSVLLKNNEWKNSGTTDAETLLHELQHAASFHVYRGVKTGTINEPSAVKAVEDIDSIYEEFSKNEGVFSSFPEETRWRLKYAAKDPLEFMAVTQSSPLVQEALKKEGLWKRFVDAIRRMLGFSRSDRTLLEQVLQAGDAVMQAQAEAAIATAPPRPEYTLDPSMDDGDLSIPEMSAPRSMTQADKMRAEEAKRSAAHYSKTPTWIKALRMPFTWIGMKDRALAKAFEQRKLEKAGLGIIESEIVSDGDKISRIIKSKGLDRDTVMSQVDNILRGFDNTSEVDPAVQSLAEGIRERIDQGQVGLAQALAESTTDPQGDRIDMILDSLGQYMSRSYLRTYFRPGLVARALHRGSAGSIWNQRMRSQHPDLYNDLVRFVDDNLVIPDDLSTMPTEKMESLAAQWGITPKGRGEDAKRASLVDQLNRQRQTLGSPEFMRDFIIEQLGELSGDSPLQIVQRGARDETILKERADVPAVVRKWWGEITDPITAAAVTFDRLGTLAAETRLLNTLADKGLGVYVFDEKHPAPSGTNLVRLNDARLGALDGKLVPPELKAQLDAQVGLNALKSTEEYKQLANALFQGLWVRPGGIAKGMATVASVPTMMMNVVSNATLAASDLAMMFLLTGRIRPKGQAAAYTPKRLVSLTVLDALNRIPGIMRARGRETNDQIKKLVETGVLRDGITLGELRGVVRRLESDLQVEASGSTTERAGRRFSRGYEALGEALADFYQLTDNIPRLISFSTQLANIQANYTELSPKQQWDVAADRARDMAPTFGRAAPIAVGGSKLLGNFATWPAEVARTLAERVDIAKEDIKNGKVMFGVAQLASVGSYVTANSFLFGALASYAAGLLGGGDDDLDEDARAKVQALASEWLSDKQLVPLQINKDNKRILAWNLTRNDPAAPIQEFVANHAQGGWPKAFEYVKDTLFGPGIYPQAVWQAVTGEDSRGRQTTRAQDFKKLVDAFTPGTVKQGIRAFRQYQAGSDVDVQLSRLMGVPVEEIDVPRELRNKAFLFRDMDRAVTDRFKREIADPTITLDEDRFRRLYGGYLREQRDLQSDYQEASDAARDLVGMNRGEIEAILKDASVSKARAREIINGRFNARQLELDFLERAEQSALSRNVRDPEYQQRIRQEFRNRRNLLRRYQGSNRLWRQAMEND